MNPNLGLPDRPDYTDELLAISGPVQPFVPHAYHDRDGDCIEFFAKPDRYYAQRIDDLVTVYHSEETEEVMGALIKGVKKLCETLLVKYPGFQIEIEDGRVKLACLFRAKIWSSKTAPNELLTLTYKKLIQVAELADAETELCEV